MLAVCRAEGVPLTARGAGTSIAGNAVGTGVVLDFSRHMNRVLADRSRRGAPRSCNPVSCRRTCSARPRRYGLRFGPDPSSSSRCTLGGMIGNNACGTRALGYGRTSDNVLGLRVLTGTGEGSPAGRPTGHSPRPADCAGSRGPGWRPSGPNSVGSAVRCPGYALENLLPENGFDVARLLVGSEGTLGRCHRGDRAAGGRAGAPGPGGARLSGHRRGRRRDPAGARPTTRSPARASIPASSMCVRERRGPQAVPPLPRGAAWLFVELTGDDPDDTVARAETLGKDCGALESLVVTDTGAAAALWRIRADGAGLSSRSPAGLPAHAGWEDAAVPPAQLGRLPARLRRPDGRLRLHRPALRPLRRRLPAHPDRLPAAETRW